MHLESILNLVERHKSFVYTQATFVERDGVELCIEVQIEPRANGRPICSGCGKKRPGYDRLAARRFEFVPLWTIAVFIVYALRRVDCPKCGVTVERVPPSTCSDAQSAWPDEESRSEPATPSRPDPQLVSGQRHDFFSRRRGF